MDQHNERVQKNLSAFERFFILTQISLIDIDGVRRLPISCIEDTEANACMDELGPDIE